MRDTIDPEPIKLDDPENASRRYAKVVPFWAWRSFRRYPREQMAEAVSG
jgi:hypothetical protein